jgi:hypothetical protein
MKEKSEPAQPFFILLIVVLLLVFISLFNIKFDLFGYKTKKVDFFSDILLQGAVKHVPLPHPIISDSILAKYNKNFAFGKTESTDIVDFVSDTSSALAHFLQALKASEEHKHKTRIAYFGDSMIEGDLITQDLRSYMQDRFGGNGVGFVPVTSIVSGFRTSIKHSFSGWTTYNLLGQVPPKLSLGISGYGFSPDTVEMIDTTSSSNTWVKYNAINKSHLNKFYEMKLLYGKSDGKNNVIINGRKYRLTGTENVNQLFLDACKDSSCINAQFQCTSPIDIFGFSFESSYGVFVDNFSFRGNSGLPISKVSKEIYAGTHQCLKYDLIILGYGVNALSPNMTSFAWYEHGMNNVIKHIKESFPNTSILLISVGDKSYKKDGVFQTDPSVLLMVEAQKRLAKKNQLAFWNLYEAMGGNGSMVKWVEGDTAYANKDYTHFNFRGAHRIGKMLYDQLVNEYKNYYSHPTTVTSTTQVIQQQLK